MLIFNCTKAAADFFTSRNKGKKITPIKEAPHKTIAESIIAHRTMQIAKSDNGVKEWHWQVHATKVKQLTVLVVMDFETRLSITLCALKKGDVNDFVETFLQQLQQYVSQVMGMVSSDPNLLRVGLEHFNNKHAQFTFHQRGDRSVQSHLNDVIANFEAAVAEAGYSPSSSDLLEFDLCMSKILRKCKSEKDYFYPQYLFLKNWIIQQAKLDPIMTEQIVNNFVEKEREAFKAIHGFMTESDDLGPDEVLPPADEYYERISAHSDEPGATGVSDKSTSTKEQNFSEYSNVVSIEHFRKK